MTRNAETPDPPVPPQAGPVAELGLVAAGLGLVIYLISFVATVGGSSSPVLALLLGGGLLAGCAALPTVRGRVLAPAAVVTTTGALLLLRAVVDDGGSALAVGALVLGLLEAGAAVGAAAMHAGLIRARAPKARRSGARPAFSGHPDGPQFPGQQYPGQPYPGTYAAEVRPVELTPDDQWTGEHAYAQNARYGGQYGVPGYPPPPPGYDPATHGAEAPAPVAAAEGVGDPASPPRGTPGTEPAADLGYRAAADPGTGAHRAVPDPGAFRPDAATGTGGHRAVPDLGTGSFRAGSASAVAEGAYGAETSPGSAIGAHRPGRSGDAHTRAFPVVPDDPRR